MRKTGKDKRQPASIVQNEQNLVSIKAFERLTMEAEGDHGICCDQEDIWLPEREDSLADLFNKDALL